MEVVTMWKWVLYCSKAGVTRFGGAFLALAAVLGSSQPAVGQSDPSNFAQVIDVRTPVSFRTLDSDTQLNLFEGGRLPRSFTIGDVNKKTTNVEGNFFGGFARETYVLGGSTVNVHGGSVVELNGRDESAIHMFGGTVKSLWSYGKLTFSGGFVPDGVAIRPEAEAIIDGGHNGATLKVGLGAMATLVGANFRLNGVPIDGLESLGDSKPFSFRYLDASDPSFRPPGDVLTGTLLDGTPFAVSPQAGDTINFGTLALQRGVIPEIAKDSFVATSDQLPFGLRQGQSLLVDDGGAVPAYFLAGYGSHVDIAAGGTIDDHFEAAGAKVVLDGGTIGEEMRVLHGTDLEVRSGSIGDSFLAYSGSTVNINGGSVGRSFRAYRGSTINISNGTVDHDSYAETGSTVFISGGTIKSGFRAQEDSTVYISGGRIDNSFDAYKMEELNISGGTIGDYADVFRCWNVTISGGTIGDEFTAFDGALELTGGSIGDDFAVAGEFTMTGGTIGKGLSAGGNISISGGTIGVGASIGGNSATISNVVVGERSYIRGSNTEILSGTFGDDLVANGRSLEILGGVFGESTGIHATDVTISGGVYGDSFHLAGNSSVKVAGNEFRLDGVPIGFLATDNGSATLEIPESSVLSGTFADGTTFAFGKSDGDILTGGEIAIETIPLSTVSPVVEVNTDSVELAGLREGQILRILHGGRLPDNFTAAFASATVLEEGGSIGSNFEAVGAEVTVLGGSVGEKFDAFTGSRVKLYDGEVGRYLEAHNGSVVTVDGAVIKGDIFAQDGSRLEIRRGIVEGMVFATGATDVGMAGGHVQGLVALDGAQIHVNGGTMESVRNSSGTLIFAGGAVGQTFWTRNGTFSSVSGGELDVRVAIIESGSQVELVGQRFLLNGTDMSPGLVPGVPFEISKRDVTLSGTLADGSPFSFNLNSKANGGHFFDPDALLTVTLAVPEPPSVLLACSFLCMATRRVPISKS